MHVFLHAAASDAAAKLDFVQGARDRDDFLEQIKHVLDLRQWERAPLPVAVTHPQSSQQPQQPQQPGAAGGGEGPLFTTRTAGVGGIIRRQEHARAAQDRLASEAFADLNTLMGKAREVVRGEKKRLRLRWLERGLVWVLTIWIWVVTASSSSSSPRLSGGSLR